MSRNIKEIGKELLGKSLNSYHRRTGLTQLEKNNEMQDGILNGILSQVDDAYIEKTEQSNVIHLDGSGDGVVILDSVEGNTMVNIIPNGRFKNNKQHWLGGDYFTTFTENDEVVGVKMSGVVEGYHIRTDFLPMKQNTEYTLIYSMKNTSTNNSIWTGVYYIDEFGVQKYLTTDNYDRNNYSSYVQKKIRFTTLQGSHFNLRFYNYCNGDDSNILYIKDVMILEGDWTNKEIPPYFEGLQSSFEEKANDEGKYEIEILSRNQDNSKQNKRKLLLNSPLLKGDKIVCKEDGLYHYHKVKQDILDEKKDWVLQTTCNTDSSYIIYRTDVSDSRTDLTNTTVNLLSTTPAVSWNTLLNTPNNTSIALLNNNQFRMQYVGTVDELKAYLQDNPIAVIYELKEPYFEKITNEYGEPILLEGYENGTMYIDSVIVPTTTVKYTPKMESFKTYKEVKAENVINDFDVTNNVIPYMMEVDMKLTELEISAYSTYNIKNTRKMEVLDMTSMQERTFNMLERLIRGKSHTKQEMIDRILLYEQAKRITTEQALELNLIIEEVYGA